MKKSSIFLTSLQIHSQCSDHQWWRKERDKVCSKLQKRERERKRLATNIQMWSFFCFYFCTIVHHAPVLVVEAPTTLSPILSHQTEEAFIHIRFNKKEAKRQKNNFTNIPLPTTTRWSATTTAATTTAATTTAAPITTAATTMADVKNLSSLKKLTHKMQNKASLTNVAVVALAVVETERAWLRHLSSGATMNLLLVRHVIRNSLFCVPFIFLLNKP